MTGKEIKDITLESLRDWFKKEKWVRISSSGNIAGPCGTSKNKKNPDRCLPKAKAQSLTKGQRAATAAKKKKAGAKGKTVVKNTKKAKVTRESLMLAAKALLKEEDTKDYTKLIQTIIDKLESMDKSIDYMAGALTGKSPLDIDIDTDTLGRVASPDKVNLTKEDITNLTIGLIHEMRNEENIEEKDDRCTRLAKQKYDTWPSAYASGAVVRCRRGEIWKKK